MSLVASRIARGLAAWAWIFLLTQSAAAQANLSFDTFYTRSDWSGWLLVLVGAATATAVLAFSGGSASPLVAAIGTWIGKAAGYSGVVATNYGLALLGGGSLASGGFGMKGGILLLSAALALAERSVEPTVAIFYERYDRARFEAMAREFATLPLPRSAAGSKSYAQAMSRLEATYDRQKPPRDPRNSETVEYILQTIPHDAAEEQFTASARAQLLTLAALLHLHQGRGHIARSLAERALMLVVNVPETGDPALLNDDLELGLGKGSLFQTEKAIKSIFSVGTWSRQNGVNYSVPASIWAITSLEAPSVDMDQSLTALETVFALEGGHPFATLVLSMYLERLALRPDYARATHYDRIYGIMGKYITGVAPRSGVEVLLLSKIMIRLFVTQQQLENVQTTLDGGQRISTLVAEQKAVLSLADKIIDGLWNDDELMSNKEDRRNIRVLLEAKVRYAVDFERRSRK